MEIQITTDLVRAAKRSRSILVDLDDTSLQEIQERYKKFLLLSYYNQQTDLAPTLDIDEMWHLHMLNPKSYHNDCMKIFGKIMDHNGGYGKEPDESPILKRVFDNTASLWKQTFKEDYIPKNNLVYSQLVQMTTCDNDGYGIRPSF